MAVMVLAPSQTDCFFKSSFLPLPIPCRKSGIQISNPRRKISNPSVSISCAAPKIVRSRPLDNLVVKQNSIRFVQKLRTLLLSKPKHYLPVNILAKCRSYLGLPDRRPLRSMIHRYPSIFEFFAIPTHPSPFNATKPYNQLCVRLTPAAEALAAEESRLQSAISIKQAEKLQKLLMLASHRRLLLTKLVHLAPDLGLPPNFRSRLCNDHPDKFKIVETSYGRALELVSWDDQLAVAIPPRVVSRDLIVDRPLKFKRLQLRKGLNLKRRHEGFLIKFSELPDVCPYHTTMEEFSKESMEAEKRTCALVREVLGLTVEKRTLLDHLTHFRKEFGLPNKLKGLILRHPEVFYMSLKGVRHSVFLVEGFSEKGKLFERDDTSVIKDKLMHLVRESKRMRQERRKAAMNRNVAGVSNDASSSDGFHDVNGDEYDDGFENIFEDSDLEDFDVDSFEGIGVWGDRENMEFWAADVTFLSDHEAGGSLPEPW
ncbi:unnamed protein product [Linum tenue]|uniref:PORR domain-containing protein n=3 Tax=Linum tenue TaxID=586396 RepID=A0AAV0P543_9ROSI|nr:unnamed protein product [Linum tenue]